VAAPDPYDELPYPSVAIEHSAPERLALASMLHGGPRPPLAGYRVLELGCGDGANLLPLAYYRPHASFLGVDGSARAIATARARRADLAIGNVELVCADVRAVAASLSGGFDFVIAHGIVSWVADDVRDALLALCAALLAPHGLVYLDYNARPGWDVRGLVRRQLLAETADVADLRERARRAQQQAAAVASTLSPTSPHPFVRLMEREFRLVCERDPAYVAHEYLAVENHAYWRSELLAHAARFDLAHVADADFNRDTGRIPDGLAELIAAADIGRHSPDDTLDLLSYRQFHSPIFARAPLTVRPPGEDELGALYVASRMMPLPPEGGAPRLFRHSSGMEVGVRREPLASALETLPALWPRGARASELFAGPDRGGVMEDLCWLHRQGVVELRLVEPPADCPASEPLNQRERAWGVPATTPYHTRLESVSGPSP
jgi:SAM-dependent methyltransferase